MTASTRLFTTDITVGTPGAKDGVAVSSTTTYYSNPVSLLGCDGVSLSFHWPDSTAVGAFTLWKSNKVSPTLTNDVDWEQVTDSLTNPNGDTPAFYDLDDASNDLDTIVEYAIGAGGNDVRVRGVSSAVAASGVVITEDTAARTVTITWEKDVSTVAEVETAIGSSSTLLDVKTAGTGATVLGDNDAFTYVTLAGGVDSTADELGNIRTRLFRVKYVNASGSGTLYGYATAS